MASTPSTVEHVAGILTGGTVGYVMGGAAAAVGAMLFPPLAPLALAVTPGIGAVLGGWFGHNVTKPAA